MKNRDIKLEYPDVTEGLEDPANYDKPVVYQTPFAVPSVSLWDEVLGTVEKYNTSKIK